MFDIITVVHNETNYNLAINRLLPSLKQYSNYPFNFHIRDNRNDNIGFAKACNEASSWGDQPYIGFLNPDAFVVDFFMDVILSAFNDGAVITGGNFGKNPVEIQGWGLNDWVCGAAMFVERTWFESMDGFDERFIWSHEETDFIRRTEQMGKVCKSFREEDLRIVHASPQDDSPEDIAWKQTHFAMAAQEYYRKWS